MTLLCVLIIYAAIQNISLNGSAAVIIPIIVGCCYIMIERIYRKRNHLPLPVCLILMYIAAPFIAGFCTFNGVSGFYITIALVTIPAAMLHLVVSLVMAGIVKIKTKT